MKAQHWIFSVRYRTENGRSLQRSAVVGPARASTVETALRLAGLLDDVCAEIRADATVRRFVEGLLDPDASGYHAPSPLTTASEWIVCIGSVHEVIREDPAIAPTKKSLLSADDEECREIHRVLSKPLREFTERNASKNATGFKIESPRRNPCCGSTGTHGEGGREYWSGDVHHVPRRWCSTCGKEIS